MLFSMLRPFLKKPLIVALIQRDTYLCACCPKNLRHTKNGLLTNVIQRHKLMRVDLSSQTLYLVQGHIESATKPLFEFRFGMSIPCRSPNEILPA